MVKLHYLLYISKIESFGKVLQASPFLTSLMGNPVLGPRISFLLGISELIKYVDVSYPSFLFEIFENDPELFNNKIIPNDKVFNNT